jgi:hypothetical protein
VIRLPNTSPQNRREYTHVRLLLKVNPDAWNGAGFEAKLFKTGAQVDESELGERPVLIEFAGPQGEWNRLKKRENLWILWRYDREERDWREIARAYAFGAEWASILRDPAIRAMLPVAPVEGVNPVARGREVAAGLLTTIDEAMVLELPAVKALALSTIYDGMAGRVAAA